MGAADELIGTSGGIAALRAQVTRLLARQASSGGRLPPILILGETGVGKGLLVRTLHRQSSRRSRPLVEVNCAAIPETLVEAELFGFERGAFTDARHPKPGLFQAAHGGVLFLDEIGMLPLGTQAKLLTALDQRQVRRLGGTSPETVDTWVLSATNEDLSAAIAKGRFRVDLFHRISAVTLRFPPLRERTSDVLALAEHFLERACADYGLEPRRLTADARRVLLAYAWPGNVRELANLMERVALLSDGTDIAAEVLDLSSPPGRRREAREASALETERDAVIEALERTNWNLSKAAARVGVPRNTLRYRIERLGLRRDRPLASVLQSPPTSPEADVVMAGLRWERRWLTALRVALAGSAHLGEFHLTPTLEQVLNKAGSFGARLEDLHPAGFTAFYGLDPMEDAPHRAALAAQAIHTALQRGTADGIAARAAVHVTECLIARGTPAPRIDTGYRRRLDEELDALLDVAPAGSTIVSSDGARFLTRAFELEPFGAAGGPVRAYRVARHVRVGFHGHGRPRSPFVGRDRELAQLDDLLAQAESGRGQLVELVGEPGAGKSRLLYEFRESLGRDRVTYVEGHCATYGGSTLYLPIVALSHDAFDLAESDAPAIVAERVGAEVSRLGLARESIVPYVLHMLGVKDEGQATPSPLNPEAMRLRITEAIRQVFVAGGQRRPMVVAIEDLQWIDPPSEEILAALAESIAACSILLLVTYRPGYRPSWLGKSYATQLVLRRLRPADSRTIVTATARAATLPRRLVDEIVARAEGNPFFLEELARAASDEEATQPSATIPDTIQGALTARLDRLPAADRDLLQVAAVIGKDGAVPLLREAAGLNEAAFALALARLRAAEFLHETTMVPVPRYAFEHVLTHEVAYWSVDSDRRRALHAVILSAIERSSPNVAERSPEILRDAVAVTAIERRFDRLDEHIEQLAHHALRADIPDRALAYLRRAGERAAARSASSQAVALYEQALPLLARQPDTAETRAAAADLHLALATERIAINGTTTSDIERCYAQARELAEGLGDAVRLYQALWGLWYVNFGRGDFAPARALGERLLALAQQESDTGRLLEAHHALWPTLVAMGEVQAALPHLETGLTLYDPGRHAAQAAHYGGHDAGTCCGSFLARALWFLGYPDRARVTMRDAVALAERLAHPMSLTITLGAAAYLSYQRGELDDARRFADRMVAIATSHGFDPWADDGRVMRACIAARQGETGDLGAVADRLAGQRTSTAALRAVLNLTTLAEACGSADDVNRGLVLLDAIPPRHRDVIVAAETARIRGELRRRLGERESAERCFREAMALARARSERSFELRAAAGLARCLCDTGRRDEARRIVAEVYGAFTEGFDTADLRTARALLEELGGSPPSRATGLD